MKFGGHAAAGGLTIAAEDLERFQVASAAETAALKDAIPGPTVTTDGEIDMRLEDLVLSRPKRMAVCLCVRVRQ